MFKRAEGKPNIRYYPKAASQTFENGDLVYAGGSGEIIPADSTSGMHLGIILKKVASTDADYAEETMVPVDVPRPGDKFLVDVGTGTLTTEMIGLRKDLKDAASIDVDATSKNVVVIEEFVSATKAIVSIPSMIHTADVATT